VARELVNRIQTLRKQSDLDVTDRIMVRLSDHDLVRDSIDSFGGYIKEEVLADVLSIDDNIDGEDIELVDGATIKIRVSKV